MNNQNRTILGVLTGLAIGGALGVLYAPKSGKETRKELSDTASHLISQAEETKNNLVSKLAEVTEHEQKRIKAYIAQVEEYIQNLRNSEVLEDSIMDDEQERSA